MTWVKSICVAVISLCFFIGGILFYIFVVKKFVEKDNLDSDDIFIMQDVSSYIPSPILPDKRYEAIQATQYELLTRIDEVRKEYEKRLNTTCKTTQISYDLDPFDFGFSSGDSSIGALNDSSSSAESNASKDSNTTKDSDTTKDSGASKDSGDKKDSTLHTKPQGEIISRAYITLRCRG